MRQLPSIQLHTVMLSITSTCCFLAALQLHQFGIYWETLAMLGFCSNPIVHQLLSADERRRTLQRQPIQDHAITPGNRGTQTGPHDSLSDSVKPTYSLD